MIGLISDTHDNLDAIRAAVRLFNDAGCDLVLHAGDVVAPFAAREMAGLRCPVRAVFGNCDGERDGLVEAFASFGAAISAGPARVEHAGRVLLLVHTDRDAERLLASTPSDILVYGHTHRAEVRKAADGRLVVNPGEAGGWLRGRKTVALLDPGTMTAEVVGL